MEQIKFDVYIVRDSELIRNLIVNDLNEFQIAIENNENLEVNIETFCSEAQALAFCAGLGYGNNERDIPSIFPLRSFEPEDKPFIYLLRQRL